MFGIISLFVLLAAIPILYYFLQDMQFFKKFGGAGDWIVQKIRTQNLVIDSVVITGVAGFIYFAWLAIHVWILSQIRKLPIVGWEQIVFRYFALGILILVLMCALAKIIDELIQIRKLLQTYVEENSRK